MDQNWMKRQRELTDRLNRYRNEYYNYNNPSVSDEVYDRLFDELHKLEQETGIQMSNSPTVTVGYPVVVKPDSGVGACNTYKLQSDEDVRWFISNKDDAVDIMEAMSRPSTASWIPRGRCCSSPAISRPCPSWTS